MTRAAVLGFAALLLAIDCSRHVDDSDANLYTVVARHLVEDGSWTELRYLDDVHPQYREHLPFGVWPMAVSIRIFGEGSLPWLSALWTLAAIALVLEFGKKLVSLEVGAFAALLLASTERFIAMGAMARLDPMLIFFALLACIPFVFDTRSTKALIGASVAAAIAVLIKGPFGLVLPVAAAIAMTAHHREWRWLVFGASLTIIALVPVTLFLLSVDETWRSGYVETQLLASARGSRSDGDTSFFAPFKSVVLTFEPWLVLALVGAWLHRTNRSVARWALLALVFLALPGRKLWHHVLLIFPLLSLLGAFAVSRAPRRLFPLVCGLIAVAGLAAVILSPPARAVSCTQFEKELSALAPGTIVTVVADSEGRQWRELSTLAREFKLRPLLAGSLHTARPDSAYVLHRADDGEWVLTPR